MIKKRKIVGAVLSGVMALTATVSAFTATTTNAADDGTMRDITTMELVRDMGLGINLGNTLESCGDWIAQWGAGGFAAGTVSSYETAWGSPVITEKMIQGYASEGFGVVRVPVAWSNMMGDNYQINEDYMKRVHEIVKWVLDADMYAIINIHYDSGWLHNLPEDPDGCKERFKVMWEQICEDFKDYGDHLMFESQNEELGWSSIWNQWSGTQEQKEQSYKYVNEVNQIFVDTVRASSGNNDERHLLISGYITDVALTCDPLFQMPTDPANRCAVSVHYYTPSTFAILEEDADWGTCRTTWGTEEDMAELETNMNLLETTYIDKGIPVIIGEYGCPKNNKDADSVQLFLSSVASEAYERQICPVLWDITELHYDRSSYRLYDQELREIFNEISGFEYNADNVPETDPTEPTTAERTYEEVAVNYTTEDYGWVFDANDADAVKFTFSSQVGAGVSGCIGKWFDATQTWETIDWEGSIGDDGKFTAIVDLTDKFKTTGLQLQCFYHAIWDNTLGDSVEVPITLDDLKLVYYNEETTEPTEPTEPEVTTTIAQDPTEPTTTTTTMATTVTTVEETSATTTAKEVETTVTTEEETTASTTQATTVTTVTTKVEPTATTTGVIEDSSVEFGTVSLLGDVDGSGVVDIADLTTLAKHILNKSLFPLKDSTSSANSDVNADKVIDSSDTAKLSEFILEKITSLV